MPFPINVRPTNQEIAEYSAAACRTINPKMKYPAIIAWVLGLCGEIAEIADMLHGVYAHHKDATELVAEFGDLLWYINAVCYELRLDMFELLNPSSFDERETRQQIKYYNTDDITLLKVTGKLQQKAGNIADVIKKAYFHKDGIDADQMYAIWRHLQILVTYVEVLLEVHSLTPNLALDQRDIGYIMQANIEKLMKRHPEGFTNDYGDKA